MAEGPKGLKSEAGQGRTEGQPASSDGKLSPVFGLSRTRPDTLGERVRISPSARKEASRKLRLARRRSAEDGQP